MRLAETTAIWLGFNSSDSGLDSMSLRERVETFIENGSSVHSLDDLLDECRRDGTADGLACVTRLFEDMYNGITFNLELKAPAAWELVLWGQPGLDELVNATVKNSASKNRSLCINVLTTVAAESITQKKPVFCSEERWSKLTKFISDDAKIPVYARSKLVEFVLMMETDEDVVEVAASGFQTASFAMASHQPAKELFAAISTRWLSTSEPLLRRYEELLQSNADDEPAFQKFLTEHPQLLDPMAAEIWPQPNLHGAQRPDFVIRRFDDSYVVVEIEVPAKLLITEGNQLSSWATHAIAQVAEYRRYLERLPAGQTYFPKLDRVDCLAIVGLEAKLNEQQRQALRNDNSQRHGLKLVGFDSLLHTARSIRANLISTGVDVRRIRVI